MRPIQGNILLALLLLIAIVGFGVEYCVSGGKPFVYLFNQKENNKGYWTYEEHLAREVREKREVELKKRIFTLLKIPQKS